MHRDSPNQIKSTDKPAKVESLAQRSTVSSYLDVYYTSQRKPYTQYPAQLCRYLSETYLNDSSYHKLLDLGCGRGEFLHGFAQCGFEVLGLDRSLHSERLFHEPTVIADLEGRPIPLAPCSVDIVFNKSVIEHIYNTDVFLSEIYRILRPGGLMLVMTPDWKAQFRHFYDDNTHVKPFTLEGISNVVKAHGFLIHEAKRFRQLPSLWRWPFLHIISDALALLPDRLKRYKVVRFSKEWMLLVVAEKPG